MVYRNPTEMETVIGSLENNSFIKQEGKALNAFRKTILQVIKKFRLAKTKTELQED